MNDTCEYRLTFSFWVYDKDGTHEETHKRKTATYMIDQRDREFIENYEEQIFAYLADRIRRMYDDDKRNESN